MIDLETVDTKPTSKILSIGACIFNPNNDSIIDTFSVSPDLIDQSYKWVRTESASTLEWWLKQPKTAYERAFTNEGRVPLPEALQLLVAFFNKHIPERTWAHGSLFDIGILENVLDQVGIQIPWKYWEVRDTRTLFESCKVSLTDNKHVTSHIAVEDAINQARTVQRAYKVISSWQKPSLVNVVKKWFGKC
jgi:inhibitor of KinA sporulation pathway (predicted exonuclease)